MTSEAFCPGHITSLFFAPEPGPTPERTGSRGAGVCISLGAKAVVSAEVAGVTSIVPKEGTRLPPGVSMALGEYLEGSGEARTVRVGLDLDLPVGNGFGMSGAMTFASLMALEGELGLMGGEVDALLALAHKAEVSHRTGLGDVVAQARGGIDLRTRPGLPPYGEVLHRRQEAEMLVAWDVEPLHTSAVLSDPKARERLEAASLPRLETLDGPPDLDRLIEAGWAFSQEAGLAGVAVRRMVELCAPRGRASQVMLGNSIYAVGDLEAMMTALRTGGFASRVTRIDNQGVRLLA